MAGEHRGRFPAKALICDFDSAGWAWVCAGGSLPRLPRTTDPRLLTAIPRMQPWSEASTAGRWVLRQPHRQYLICLTPRGPAELDLTGDRESYQVQSLNPATGEISTQQQRVAGGRTVDLARFVNSGLSVLWLQRAEPGEALK